MMPKPSITKGDVLAAWGRILRGNVPILSIEITRECPLNCPGCYAYGEKHLGGGVTLEKLNDFQGERLVQGVLDLVKRHKPLHVSLVGGEPLVRHRELSRILPRLSEMGVFTMVVTSGIIPIPPDWMRLPRIRVALSVDGLPEHHDPRRRPATYEVMLKNIEGRTLNIHWVITRAMLERRGYLEEYVKFWNGRPEVDWVWASGYTPQLREQSAEMLSSADRETLARELPRLAQIYKKFAFPEGMGGALRKPPASPDDCLFAKMSVNYSADLQTRVEPCVFGGTPDCSACGCAASSALHWVRGVKLAGPVKVGHFITPSVNIGRLVNRLCARAPKPPRWGTGANSFPAGRKSGLVQIRS